MGRSENHAVGAGNGESPLPRFCRKGGSGRLSAGGRGEQPFKPGYDLSVNHHAMIRVGPGAKNFEEVLDHESVYSHRMGGADRSLPPDRLLSGQWAGGASWPD